VKPRRLPSSDGLHCGQGRDRSKRINVACPAIRPDAASYAPVVRNVRPAVEVDTNYSLCWRRRQRLARLIADMNDGLEKRGISSVFGDELSPFRYDTIQHSYRDIRYDTIYRSFTTISIYVSLFALYGQNSWSCFCQTF